ncbi:hypothetical protein Pelo_11962 [Pelomyxa schiedti]|nr:hypothetical protein Pelo_11962 [Pelomyxa schiedti]
MPKHTSACPRVPSASPPSPSPRVRADAPPRSAGAPSSPNAVSPNRGRKRRRAKPPATTTTSGSTSSGNNKTVSSQTHATPPPKSGSAEALEASDTNIESYFRKLELNSPSSILRNTTALVDNNKLNSAVASTCADSNTHSTLTSSDGGASARVVGGVPHPGNSGDSAIATCCLSLVAVAQSAVACDTTPTTSLTNLPSEKLSSPYTTCSTGTQRRELATFMREHPELFRDFDLEGALPGTIAMWALSVQRRNGLAGEAAKRLAEQLNGHSKVATTIAFILDHPLLFSDTILQAPPEILLGDAEKKEKEARGSVEVFAEASKRVMDMNTKSPKIEATISFMANHLELFNDALLKALPEVLLMEAEKKLMEVCNAADTLEQSCEPQQQEPHKFHLDISSPEGMFSSIEELAKNIGLRIATHTNKLVDPVVFSDLKDREDILYTVEAHLHERFEDVKTDPRTLNPLIFLSGAPGSGKKMRQSRALDELVKRFENSTPTSNMSDCCCVTVTWNGVTPYNASIDECGKVAQAVERDPVTILKKLFGAIKIHSKKSHILLCVDEILKADETPVAPLHSEAICHTLGGVMDVGGVTIEKLAASKKTSASEMCPSNSKTHTASVIMVVISCLNKGWVLKQESQSGRRIVLLLLDPISFDSSLELFNNHFQSYGKDAEHGLRKVISDTGGLPCLLVGLNHWLNDQKERESALSLLNNHTYSLSAIRRRTRSGLYQDTILYDSIVGAIVCAQKLNTDSLIGGQKFCDLVSAGYLFSRGSIPCISIMNLLQFATQGSTSIANSTFEEIPGLLRMAEGSRKTIQSIWSSGTPLEDFVSLHPILLTLCAAETGDREFSINQMFGIPRFQTVTQDSTVIFPREPTFYCWNVQARDGKTHDFAWWVKKCGSPSHPNLQVGSIVRCCHTNPGFEVAFLLQSADGASKYIICVECKYSELTSKAVLTSKMVQKKWNSTQSQMQGLMKNTHWKGATVVLIIVTLRKLPAGFDFGNTQQNNSRNILILDRTNFTQYLGPTIGSLFNV